jgi:hypothetical protein
MMMTVAERAAHADQHAKMLRALEHLERARDQLLELRMVAKENQVVEVRYDYESLIGGYVGRQRKTAFAKLPIAVLIQQAIYTCQKAERAVVQYGGVVPADPRVNRR